ncbi:MAG: leucine-rich repeat domain-containing protein [Candidatus Heimdallarchaeota archaeon]|nr:leucine-rich repeat domain-containing protein [Candidatus Heimdallarchaeota archaeon]
MKISFVDGTRGMFNKIVVVIPETDRDIIERKIQSFVPPTWIHSIGFQIVNVTYLFDPEGYGTNQAELFNERINDIYYYRFIGGLVSFDYQKLERDYGTGSIYPLGENELPYNFGTYFNWISQDWAFMLMDGKFVLYSTSIPIEKRLITRQQLEEGLIKQIQAIKPVFGGDPYPLSYDIRVTFKHIERYDEENYFLSHTAYTDIRPIVNQYERCFFPDPTRGEEFPPPIKKWEIGLTQNEKKRFLRRSIQRIPTKDKELSILPPFKFKELEKFLEKESTLFRKIHDEFLNSGGNLSLDITEFSEHFGSEKKLTDSIVEKLCNTGFYELSGSPDTISSQEKKRVQVHSRFRANFWLFSVLTEIEAKALLELGALLKTPFNKSIRNLEISDLHLRRLTIQSEPITSLPESIGDFEYLERLKIQSCLLKTIPDTIGNLKNLTLLDLDYNELTSLPETLGNLENLQELWVRQNMLKSLPASLNNLKKLQTLSTDFNLF